MSEQFKRRFEMRVLIKVCKNDSPAVSGISSLVCDEIRKLNLEKIDEGSNGWEVFRGLVYSKMGKKNKKLSCDEPQKPFCLVHCKSKTSMDEDELFIFNQIRIAIQGLEIEFVHVLTED